MATADVRANDSRGRHTTTHRALLQLPSGGCLIDTPGMRELKLTGEENLDLFADIEALAEQCRFADCGHGSEPGCAVQAALDTGELTAERWRNFLKLHDEREEQAASLEARLRRQRGGRPMEKPRGVRDSASANSAKWRAVARSHRCCVSSLDRRCGSAIALQSRIGAATFTLMSASESREPRTPTVTSFSGLPATLALRVVAPA